MNHIQILDGWFRSPSLLISTKLKSNMPSHNNRLIKGQEISPDEYGDFYSRYIEKSKDCELFEQLEYGSRQVTDLLQLINDKQALHRYEESKWSIKEVVGHMSDTERIMAYRALSFARGDDHSLPGFDQDSYVEAANFNDMSLDELIKDYKLVRSSTISLFSSFNDKMLMALGTASGSEFSVRALGFVIIGHEIHHLEILKEMYLPGITS